MTSFLFGVPGQLIKGQILSIWLPVDGNRGQRLFPKHTTCRKTSRSAKQHSQHKQTDPIELLLPDPLHDDRPLP